MSIVFTNAKVFLGGYDISGDLNQVALEYGAESLDATVFGAASRTMLGGLRKAKMTGKGFVQEGNTLVGQSMFDNIGNNEVAMLFPDGITEGATSTGSGYMFQVMRASYTPGGAVGELYAFDFAAEGRGVGA